MGSTYEPPARRVTMDVVIGPSTAQRRREKPTPSWIILRRLDQREPTDCLHGSAAPAGSCRLLANTAVRHSTTAALPKSGGARRGRRSSEPGPEANSRLDASPHAAVRYHSR